MKFDPQNRICIAGPEGCPVCVASLRETAHRENFTVTKEELLGLPDQEVEAIGLCLLVQPGTLINLGDSCSFSSEDYQIYAPKSA
jgi:predicted ThiF/HesA family dinucleotide-utilizing enzyme